MSYPTRILSVSACLIAIGLTWAADDAKPVSTTPVPVDDDMYHLMEYVFEPAYKRLKSAFAEDAGNELPWKAIKGDALTLAEATNLLLFRAPEKDADKWVELAVQTRQAGAKLYKAAGEKSGDIREHYRLTLKSCSACHDQFADGEHQLRP